MSVEYFNDSFDKLGHFVPLPETILSLLLRELKKSFQYWIVDLISFVNGKIKKYVTVGKRISSSFKRAQPEVSSFIRLGDTLSWS